MISYEEFGKLRLRGFTFDDDYQTLDNWEFMDRVWVGESLGFTEFLRLKSDPAVTRSIAIDFDDFLLKESSRLLETLGLPLRPGMHVSELKQVLGEPQSLFDKVDDRITFEYVLPGPPPYHLSCTLNHDDGLVYFVLMRPFD